MIVLLIDGELYAETDQVTDTEVEGVYYELVTDSHILRTHNALIDSNGFAIKSGFGVTFESELDNGTGTEVIQNAPHPINIIGDPEETTTHKYINNEWSEV